MRSKVVASVLDYEMIHWNEEDLFLANKANKITYIRNGKKKIISIPTKGLGWKRVFLPFRLARRALRLDKTIIVPNRCGFVAIRNSRIYVYDDENDSWFESDMTLNCRNPMYNAVLKVEGVLYIGEYGNPNGIGKRVLMSKDDGHTWQCVHQFEPDEIRHIHALLWDEFEKKIWIFTGDFNPKPQVFKADSEFNTFERVGGGTQQWRACHALFSEKYVDWIMDSPLEEVRQIRFDRKTKQLTVGQSFPGPVWYAREYGNSIYATTVQEEGPSHKDKKLHIFRSYDYISWHEVASFHHDGWPKRFFRFGVLLPIRGREPLFSCEGVKGFDGKTIKLSE